LNNMQLCCNRDAQIVTLLNTHAVLCTEQIAALSFVGKYRLKMARRRLLSLTEHGRVLRRKFAPYASNVYCVEGWPKQWEHQLGINWVYCWLRQNLRPGESLYHWQAPYYSGSLRPDAFYGVRSGSASEFGFLELDRSTNSFDKVRLYNAYYKEKAYQGEWWTQQASRFPSILIVTTTPARANKIRRSIATDNTSGLTFHVYLLSELRDKVVSSLMA
jgi:hypothetical protein